MSDCLFLPPCFFFPSLLVHLFSCPPLSLFLFLLLLPVHCSSHLFLASNLCQRLNLVLEPKSWFFKSFLVLWNPQLVRSSTNCPTNILPPLQNKQNSPLGCCPLLSSLMMSSVMTNCHQCHNPPLLSLAFPSPLSPIMLLLLLLVLLPLLSSSLLFPAPVALDSPWFNSSRNPYCTSSYSMDL